MRADALDEYVFGQVSQALLDPQQLLAGERAVLTGARDENELVAGQLKRLNAAIDAKHGERARLLDAYQASLFDLDELTRRTGALTTRRDQLARERETLTARSNELATQNRLRHRLAGFSERIAATLDDLDFDGRQRLLRLVVEHVRVSGWRVEIHLKIPLPNDPPTDDDPPGDGPPGPDRPDPGPSRPRPLSTDVRLRSVHAIRLGWAPVSDPDPHRARPRDRRAHLGDWSHHRDRTATPHQPGRARERAAEPLFAARLPPSPAAPEGGDPDPLKRTGLDRQLASTHNGAPRAGQLRLSTQARRAWADAYQRLAEPQPGIAGAISARAEAHTIRLALIYALLDTTRRIQPAHLTAALALWDYALRSASWALGRTTGDPLARQIHTALTHALPGGLTRTQLRDLLHRNPTTSQLDQTLAALAHDGKITSQRVLTAGRPAELWTATR